MKAERNKKPRPPLDSGALERLALFYAGRYATTRAKLGAYLRRKIKERGWEGEAAPPIDRLVARFAELGYVNDRAFASARAASLQRRGYGARRLDQDLHAAGIDQDDAAPAKEQAERGAWAAAIRFAERKRIGPFALEELDNAARQRAFGAMLRAGHPMDLVRKIIQSRRGEIPNVDDL